MSPAPRPNRHPSPRSSETALAAENGLRNRHRIVVGQRLRIPVAEPVTIAAASPPKAKAPSVSAAPVPEPEVKSAALVATAAVTPATFPPPANWAEM